MFNSSLLNKVSEYCLFCPFSHSLSLFFFMEDQGNADNWLNSFLKAYFLGGLDCVGFFCYCIGFRVFAVGLIGFGPTIERGWDNFTRYTTDFIFLRDKCLGILQKWKTILTTGDLIARLFLFMFIFLGITWFCFVHGPDATVYASSNHGNMFANFSSATVS